ncbi:MAG: hypothetical protein VB957_12615 [Pseudomonadales bacterium]
MSKVMVSTKTASKSILKSAGLFLILFLQVACAHEVHSHDYSHKNDSHGNRAHDIDKVFGNIKVGEKSVVGDVSSVNGGIVLRDDSKADDVETVNVSIRIEDNVAVRSVETVNGSIRAGQNFKVRRDVATINGSIDLQQGSTIGDDVTTVNGSIHLNNTLVEGNLETVNGDIKLAAGSRVQGNIIFEKNSWNSGNFKLPKLIVDASSIIEGEIHLYRKVTLIIDENAEVGEIISHF